MWSAVFRNTPFQGLPSYRQKIVVLNPSCIILAEKKTWCVHYGWNLWVCGDCWRSLCKWKTAIGRMMEIAIYYIQIIYSYQLSETFYVCVSHVQFHGADSTLCFYVFYKRISCSSHSLWKWIWVTKPTKTLGDLIKYRPLSGFSPLSVPLCYAGRSPYACLCKLPFCSKCVGRLVVLRDRKLHFKMW